MIAIVDYGMGNLRSVANAFTAIGAHAQIASCPADLSQAEAIVLPGVGAFGDGIANLHRTGFARALEEQVLQQKKPFLGICLGMQLLATTGLEHGRHAGLNWIPGVVQRLSSPPGDRDLRIPHVGWDDVSILTRHGLYADVDEPRKSFYFVHSYVLVPDDAGLVTGRCDYGIAFAASVERDHIWATQVHPEKSHQAGLGLLKQWCARVSLAC